MISVDFVTDLSYSLLFRFCKSNRLQALEICAQFRLISLTPMTPLPTAKEASECGTKASNDDYVVRISPELVSPFSEIPFREAARRADAARRQYGDPESVSPLCGTWISLYQLEKGSMVRATSAVFSATAKLSVGAVADSFALPLSSQQQTIRKRTPDLPPASRGHLAEHDRTQP